LLGPIGCVSGFGGHARGSAGRASVAKRASPRCGGAGCSRRWRARVPNVGRSVGTARCGATSGDADANVAATSFTCPGPKPRAGASSTSPKRRRSYPVGSSRQAVRALEGSIGEGMSAGTCRSGCSRAPSPGGCLPPASHRGGAQAQDTQRECDDISHGVRILSAFEPRRSLCRFTSPAPSALRVSHPLSGLSPPGPRGFVSRHIRP